MKRKYFSALLMGALTIASVSTFTSCKDYDDDISNLQQQIDSNAKAIETIQNLIKGGGLVTGVTETSDGITVKLSDGKSVTISNGKDGAPGTAWTIGADGYWYENGKKTDNLARGPQGEKGEKGDQGVKGGDTWFSHLHFPFRRLLRPAFDRIFAANNGHGFLFPVPAFPDCFDGVFAHSPACTPHGQPVFFRSLSKDIPPVKKCCRVRPTKHKEKAPV